MEDRQNFSSSFVNKWAILALAVLVLVSSYFGLFSLAVFFLFLTLLFSASYFWGKGVLRRVEIQVESSGCSSFPGERVPVTFQIRNQKLLPLIWLELLLKCEDAVCVEPEKAFEKELHRDEKTGETCAVWKRKFTWILWHETLEWQTWFRAVRRGVYFLDEVSVLSGDGFGLCIRRADYPLPDGPVFVVYPRLQEVRTDVFLKQMYDADVGQRGVYEDRTLLKNIRDYQNGDPFKKINWRVLARQNSLQVNVYETILPRSTFFLLDLESFRKEEADTVSGQLLISSYEEELEEMLSVLGSLCLRLTEQQMSCGLGLPQQGQRPGLLLLPDGQEGWEHRLLMALAGISYQGEQTFFDQAELAGKRNLMGQIYVAARRADALTCQELLSLWGEEGVTLLCGEDTGGTAPAAAVGGYPGNLPCLLLSDLRREADQ